MIAPLNTRMHTAAPMEKSSPIITGEHNKTSSLSTMFGCKDDVLPKINTTINRPSIKGSKHYSEYTAPTCNSIAGYDTEKHTKIKENKAESNTSISPLVPVGSSIGLRRLKRKLFLQRVSASKTTQGTSTSSSVTCGYDSTRTRTTSTRTSASSIGDEELRKMLTERLFRGSISHN